ncbi:MAG: hypothetical protein P8P56_07250 [Yoonia sp.]|nr:hypothetical protein [Yoonia sp.]
MTTSLVDGAGSDVLNGGHRADRPSGGNGNVRLNGGASRDVMTGGAGADDFIFIDGDSSTANSKRAVITDFETGGGRAGFEIELLNVNSLCASDFLL